MKFIPDTSASPGFFGGPATQTPNTYPMPISTVYPVGATGADVLSWTYNGGQNNY